MGTGSFLGVKWPGHGVDHPPQSSVEVKERVALYLYPLPPRAFIACSKVNFTFLFNSQNDLIYSWNYQLCKLTFFSEK
jgi:hypothetical protein